MTGLESRVLMCADHALFSSELGSYPAITEPRGAAPAGAAEPVAATVALGDVPALHSRPSAAAKLYLDFDGDVTATWGSDAPGTTPSYDTDGDATTFSDAEIASIREIWARLSEKFSPFNLDVTTVNPGSFGEKQALHVVIGGDGAWLGEKAGGVAYVDGFSSRYAPNTVFVFENNLANGYAKYVAEAAAHESGHAFGLQHQATWSGNSLVAEYSTGPGDGRIPIMGASYNATRGLWWSGTPSTSSTATQDDLAIISGSNNGFGYRGDDFAGTLAAASPLTLSGAAVGGAGVIEKTSDADTFSFSSAAGAINLAADVAAQGPMLDLKLDLRDSSGVLLAAADTASPGENLSFNLPSAGTYYVTVASHGSYGDVGQYTLHGTVVVPAAAPHPGDVNLDGVVNFADLSILSQNYNQPTTLGWSAGDFNADGIVDFNDLTALAQNYSQAAPTSSESAALAVIAEAQPAAATPASSDKGSATRMAALKRPAAAFSRKLIPSHST